MEDNSQELAESLDYVELYTLNSDGEVVKVKVY